MNRILLFALLSFLMVKLYAQSQNQNYVRTIQYLDKDRTDSIVSVQYYDGLGRPIQVVSSGMNTHGTYLCSYQTYDGCDREQTAWLPAVSSVTPEYLSLEDIRSFNTYHDSYAYSTISYDALDRPVQVSSPGESWRDRGKCTRYVTNEDNEVKHYTSKDLTGSNYYNANTLYCTETTDEHGNITKQFKDMHGNLVLVRMGNDAGDTYYVYNDFMQLVYVLPPMYQNNPDLDLFAFQYKYDYRGRIAEKKIPGCSPVRYLYDDSDRMISMQDGPLAEKELVRIYEYDKIGRVIRQSIAKGDVIEYDEFVNYYDTYDYLMDHANIISLGQSDESAVYDFGYGQKTGTWQRLSNGEGLLTTYTYDEYGRVHSVKEFGLNKHLTEVYNYYNFVNDIDSIRVYEKDYVDGHYVEKYSQTIKNYYYPHTKLLASSLLYIEDKVNNMSRTDTLQHLTYDDFGHIIGNDRSGTAADMSYAYDILHGWTTGIKSAGGFEQILYRETEGKNPRWDGSISAMTWKACDNTTRRYDYTYDGLNRLTKAEYSFTKAIEAAENPIDYPAEPVEEPKPELPIEDPIFQPVLPGIQSAPLQALIPASTLEVAASTSIASDVSHASMEQEEQSYYAASEDYTESATYDLNCNITSLQRYGMKNSKQYGLIDDLQMSYNGNQRMKVDDAVSEQLTYTGAFDFVDGSTEGDDYAYNGNGALTMDLNKGIQDIEYDLLGNPRKVTMSDGRSIEYIYSADGRRLRTIHKRELPVMTVRGRKQPRESVLLVKDSTDYIGNLILCNGKPQMYRFSGGYYSFDDNGALGDAHFYIHDYQGNNRMVVNARTNEVEQTTHYYPYGGIIGDLSSNQEAQKYKYSNKELDRTYGLDLYDVEARQYDAAAPVFNRPDDHATDYYPISPYAYCAGDPVNCVDPTGMKPDTLESAYMSQDVYNSKLGEYSGEWQCVSRSNGGSFKWAVYAKGSGDSQEYVLAFAGTDDLYDAITDVYQGNGNINGSAADYSSTEYGKAIELAKAVVSFAGDKTLTIVGHSLGASLASLAAMAIGKEAMVFNPAAIHDNTIKTFGIDTSNHGDLISTFIVQKEAISYVNGYTDNSKTYGTKYPISGTGGVGARHRISSVIKALQNQ